MADGQRPGIEDVEALAGGRVHARAAGRDGDPHRRRAEVAREHRERRAAVPGQSARPGPSRSRRRRRRCPRRRTRGVRRGRSPPRATGPAAPAARRPGRWSRRAARRRSCPWPAARRAQRRRGGQQRDEHGHGERAAHVNRFALGGPVLPLAPRGPALLALELALVAPAARGPARRRRSPRAPRSRARSRGDSRRTGSRRPAPPRRRRRPPRRRDRRSCAAGAGPACRSAGRRRAAARTARGATSCGARGRRARGSPRWPGTRRRAAR